MVMVWGLFLALSAACVSVNAQFDGTANAAFNLGLSTNGEEFNSYFGAEACDGGDCAYEEDSDVHQDEYEPHFPEQPVTPEPVYPEHPVFPEEPTYPVYPEHPVFPEEPTYPVYPEPQEPSAEYPEMVKPDICRNLLEASSVIGSRHPDINDIQFGILDELIKLVVEHSIVENGHCDPAVKFLDIIITAAEQLRFEYSSETCEYQTEESSEFTTSDYDHMEGTGTPYPEVSSTESTVEYEPSDEPCTEESTTPGYQPSMKPCPKLPIYEPSTDHPSYEPSKPEEPCPDKPSDDYIPTEEIIAEEYEHYGHISPPFVGSHRGIPGVHYPNYTEVPITSFSCADKKFIPGFYADLETGCQVFHVCYEHRRESFLCPIGTIFNQPILACDYWYSSNCSLAPDCYDVNIKTPDVSEPEVDELPEDDLDELVQFLPVKAKVTVFTKPSAPEEKIVPVEKPVVQEVEEVASEIFDKIISTTRVVSKPRKDQVTIQIKKPVPLIKPKLVKAAVFPVLKAKAVAKVALAKAAVPVLAKAKIAAVVPAKIIAKKAAVPVLVKAKIAAAVPVVAKAKLAVATKAKLAAGKVVAVKAVPAVAKVAAVTKAKLAAGKVVAVKTAVPIVAAGKVVAVKTAIPIVAAGKVVAVKTAVPIVAKAKLATAVKVAVPVAAKGKFAAAAKFAVPAKVFTAKKLLVKGAIPVAAKTKLVAAASGKFAVKAAPVLKGKILAASLPFAKSAFLKAALPAAKFAPIMKAKLASVPVVKGKLLALPLAKSMFAYSSPLVKAKVVKAAAISPLTKKALALGYMKLLKAKKLALVG